MEPVIINPNSEVDKDTEAPKEGTNETNVQPPAVPESNAAESSDNSGVNDQAAASVPQETEEPMHKEVLPSLTIPPETPVKNPGSKKKVLAAFGVVLVLAGATFGAFQLLGKKDTKTIEADQSVKEVPELRIGSSQIPFSVYYPDPNFVAGASYSVNLQVYEGLVGFKNANSFVPLLAESWTNPDDLTWVFKLKPDVKFHNGSVMTAEDVKRSIDDAIAGQSVPALLIETIDTVTVQDAEHVAIKTKTPDAILINKLPFLFVTSTEKVNGVTAGTGAYRQTADPVTDKSLTLEAFDDYHGGRPAVRKVSWVGFDTEPELFDAVKAGTVDVTDTLVDLGTEPEDVPGYNKVMYSVGDISFIGINALSTRSPLSKLKVRQALKAAIDPEAFITASNRLGNVPTQMTVLANFGFNPELEKPVRDIEKAKQLLKEAGYPNGVKITAAIMARRLETVSSIVTQAAEAGITINLQQYEDPTAYYTTVDAGETELYYLSVTSALVDSYDIFAYNFRGKNFNNPTLNKLLDDSTGEFDTTKRKKLLQDASKLVVDEVAALPMAENLSVYYVRDNLSMNIDPAGYSIAGYIRNISAK